MGFSFSEAQPSGKMYCFISCGKCEPRSTALAYRRTFGQNSLAFYWSGQQALKLHVSHCL